jgi:hypothetical protein
MPAIKQPNIRLTGKNGFFLEGGLIDSDRLSFCLFPVARDDFQ